MPRTKRPKPLYQRGQFSLYPRAGRNPEIVWYDDTAKRERSASAGTSDIEQAKLALDRKYLQAHGGHYCPRCGQATDGEVAALLLSAITDYMLKNEHQAGYVRSTKPRLSKVIEYIAATDPAVTVPAVTPQWVEKFRRWLAAQPVVNKAGAIVRDRSPGGIEGCVLQLAAVINSTTGHKAQFKARSVKDLARSPVYRADVDTLAAMFRFCLYPEAKPKQRWSAKVAQVIVEGRTNLLRYLRAAVTTWARPDAIYDLRAKGQWYKDAGVLALNRPGRVQTKKYRPSIPVARQFKPWLDEAMERENYLPVSTIRHTWDAMRTHIGLPGEAEAGEKLIRRSVSTICRRYIGEANWAQGEMMLGHRKASISDIYALPDPANLGLALEATERLIDEIESRVPGAFTASLPRDNAIRPSLRVV
ncbi:hypothetical protein [Novosphingobium sp. Leaf2]|uniref:hypothetical protein n=1 Tax=Novosphingobium sp. Leaf2 TaxID=1735670 RepID=UPI0006F910E6|nr:hypothetical protein [Novosphingobium sp. Leaf2]KQM18418.1 hypothetical protein ASE49_09410 [Novosphingobium sp. Leaf2]